MVPTLMNLLQKDPKRRLSFRKKCNPLQMDQFFANGVLMIQNRMPPITPTYISTKSTDKENKNIYFGSGGRQTRSRKKGEALLPRCRDKISERDNAQFEDFGTII